MRDYASNDELLADLRGLIERWCDQRKLGPLYRILGGYLALNGLTDGWADLLEALKATRAIGFESLGQKDWDTLCDLIHATEGIVYRR